MTIRPSTITDKKTDTVYVFITYQNISSKPDSMNRDREIVFFNPYGRRNVKTTTAITFCKIITKKPLTLQVMQQKLIKRELCTAACQRSRLSSLYIYIYYVYIYIYIYTRFQKRCFFKNICHIYNYAFSALVSFLSTSEKT